MATDNCFVKKFSVHVEYCPRIHYIRTRLKSIYPRARNILNFEYNSPDRGIKKRDCDDVEFETSISLADRNFEIQAVSLEGILLEELSETDLFTHTNSGRDLKTDGNRGVFSVKLVVTSEKNVQRTLAMLVERNWVDNAVLVICSEKDCNKRYWEPIVKETVKTLDTEKQLVVIKSTQAEIHPLVTSETYVEERDAKQTTEGYDRKCSKSCYESSDSPVRSGSKHGYLYSDALKQAISFCFETQVVDIIVNLLNLLRSIRNRRDDNAVISSVTTLDKLIFEVEGLLAQSITERGLKMQREIEEQKVSHMLAEDILRIDGVYGCGTFYDRLCIHIEPEQQRDKDKIRAQINEVTRRHNYNKGFDIQTVISKPQLFEKRKRGID